MSRDTKTALIIGGLIVGLFIILSLIFGLLGGWQGFGYGMMGPGMMGIYGWGWFMPVFMIVLWGLVIWGFVALVRDNVSSNYGNFSQPDSALEILKRRYARGEITKQEYDERKKDLV